MMPEQEPQQQPMERHPDLFDSSEAAAYLRVRDLAKVRERWALKPLPLGQGLYHRRDLDAVVLLAIGEDPYADQTPTKTPGGRR